MQSLERVVVGVDFTESSLAVAQWAGRHLAEGAGLTLVHVIAMSVRPNAPRRLPGLVLSAEDTLRGRVRSFAGALRGLAGLIGGPNVDVEVRVGDPAVELHAHADALDADLVIIGGNPVFHGAPRVDARTTERLVRDLTRPVLIARNVQGAPTTVLAALGNDPDQAAVLATARTLAERTAARVSTLRLSVTGPVETLRRAPPAPRSPGVAEPHYAVGTREQVRMILDVAREVRADLIVVGRSTTSDGDDVARMLARTASCSVLVVGVSSTQPPPARRSRSDSGPTTRRCWSSARLPGSAGGAGPTRPAAARPTTDAA